MTTSDSASAPKRANQPPADPADEPSGALPNLSVRGWILVGLGLAAMTAVAAWVGLNISDQPVRWRNVGYTVDSPFEATATFDVFLYTDAPVTCHVRALNIRYIEVGAATQSVSPANGPEQRFTTPVTTTETANTVIVEYCEVDG